MAEYPKAGCQLLTNEQLILQCVNNEIHIKSIHEYVDIGFLYFLVLVIAITVTTVLRFAQKGIG